MTLLELTDVTAFYGPVQVLEGISLSVPEGGAVGILGANGAGKTTTLRAISGTVRGMNALFTARRFSPLAGPELSVARVATGLRTFIDRHGTRSDDLSDAAGAPTQTPRERVAPMLQKKPPASSVRRVKLSRARARPQGNRAS